MTEILCYDDSYLREFDATVIDTAPKGVVLDRTAFYPGGGGQPADSGALTAARCHTRSSAFCGRTANWCMRLMATCRLSAQAYMAR